MHKKLTIEDVPCYQCICLAICCRRTLYDVEETCPLLKEFLYTDRDLPYQIKKIRDQTTFAKWTLVLKAMRKI